MSTSVIETWAERAIPAFRRLRDENGRLESERSLSLQAADEAKAARERESRAMAHRVAELEAQLAECEAYLATDAMTLNYRRAHFETHGSPAPGLALPDARAFPDQDNTGSYRDKMVGHLSLTGRGAEIGALNIPLITKQDVPGILYVDHLDTEGLRRKYPTLPDIVPIDRPMVDDSIESTLRDDGPLDYLVASQVMEHVPNPIKWLREGAAVLRPGGRFAIALPDRRGTFDFYRPESRPSDMVAAFIAGATIPDQRSLYDHFTQVTAVNMHWAIPESLSPEEIVAGRGTVLPKRIRPNALEKVREGKDAYLDCHCWVFTSVSFLLLMAQLAKDGFLDFRLAQFYPMDPALLDRTNHSFVAVLEKVGDGTPAAEIAGSYLAPLGPRA